MERLGGLHGIGRCGSGILVDGSSEVGDGGMELHIGVGRGYHLFHRLLEGYESIVAGLIDCCLGSGDGGGEGIELGLTGLVGQEGLCLGNGSGDYLTQDLYVLGTEDELGTCPPCTATFGIAEVVADTETHGTIGDETIDGLHVTSVNEGLVGRGTAIGHIALLGIVVILGMGRLGCGVVEHGVHPFLIAIDIGICLVLLLAGERGVVGSLVAGVDGELIESVLEIPDLLMDIEYHVGAFTYGQAIGGEGDTRL